MRIIQSSMFRAICAVVIGVLLISNPDSTVKWITMVIGVMFLLSGVISISAWLTTVRGEAAKATTGTEGRLPVRRRPLFPVVGLGSVLLGLILVLMPGLFVKSLMYVLGAIIVIGAVSQFATLVGMNRTLRVPLFMWICPSVILLAGLVVLIKPMETAALPLVIAGWCLMLYGVVELVNAYALYRRNKALRTDLDNKQTTGQAD